MCKPILVIGFAGSFHSGKNGPVHSGRNRMVHCILARMDGFIPGIDNFIPPEWNRAFNSDRNEMIFPWTQIRNMLQDIGMSHQN